MYSFAVLFSNFSDRLHVLLSLLTACLLATALFYLLIAPAHNLLKAFIAYKQGDENVPIRGHLRFNPKKSFNWVGVVSSLVIFMPIVHPVYYKNYNFYERKKGTIKVALSGIMFYFICGVILSYIYLIFQNMSLFNIKTVLSAEFSPDASRIIYHCFFSTIYFLVHLCFYTFFINLLPIVPLDCGEILCLVFRPNWVDSLKNNEVLVSFLVFFASLLTVAGPTGLFSQLTNDFMNFLFFMY